MTLKGSKQESDKESLKKHIEEMELNEKHLSLIYNTLSDAIFLLAVEPDDRFRFVFVNRAFLSVTGLTSEQVVGKRIEQVLPKTTHALVISKYKEAISENNTFFMEHASAYPTSERVGAVTVTPVWNAGGVCTHLVGTLHDLSGHKKAEDSLRESEQRLRLREAQKIARIGRWDLDLISNRLQLSDSIFELFEIDPMKFKASYEAFLDAIHPDDRDKVNLAYTGSLKTKLPYEISHRLLMKDGRIKWVHEMCRTEYDSQGQALRSVGIVQDITERKKVEEALNQEKERAETYLNMAGVMMVAIDTQGIVTMINRKGCKILGYDETDILGNNWFDNFIPERIASIIKPISERLLRGEIEPTELFENPVLTRGGEERLIAWHNTIIRNEEGEIIGHLSSGEDITERKKAEVALRERMKELKCLYNIAEISNRPGIAPDELFQESVSLLPPGWQYPEITGSRITVDGKVYSTKNFKETKWMQREDIHIINKIFGTVEVCYLEEKPDENEGPFLKEERELIENIARQLGEHIIRKQAEEKLQKLNNELEQRVKDRTAALEEKNEELEQFNRVFVGRKLRMAELKEQIAKLEKDAEPDKKVGDKTS